MDIEQDLTSLKKLVGGDIVNEGTVELKAHNVALLTNKTGLWDGLPYNQNLYPFFFTGTVVLCGMKNGRYVGLTNKQIDYLSEWFERLTMI